MEKSTPENSISIHALLAESDRLAGARYVILEVFLSTLSLRRATVFAWANSRSIGTFLSTLSLRRATLIRVIGRPLTAFLSTLSLRRATVNFPCQELGYYAFLSTLSLRRATVYAVRTRTDGLHFYPRSPCGERHGAALADRTRSEISIHALLAESDCWVAVWPLADIHFYPRSPCGERRPTSWTPTPPPRHFYPRSPCGERHFRSYGLASRHYFYPRSPCGERLGVRNLLFAVNYFYPRSPCGERLWMPQPTPAGKAFLSTLSLRRATGKDVVGSLDDLNFYPRSPCGERQRLFRARGRAPEFLSTLSLRRATRCFARRLGRRRISIHALLAESDAAGVFAVIFH